LTNTTHTQGPWWRDDDGFIAAGSGETYVTIADVDFSDLDIDEREANARLIAAAPDMLAALERASPWLIKAHIDGAFDGCALPLGGRKAWEKIERAIAKAKGEE
jgi:hypothetical protein